MKYKQFTILHERRLKLISCVKSENIIAVYSLACLCHRLIFFNFGPTCVFLSGNWRRPHWRAADVENDTQIHGQVIYRDLFLGNDRQTERIWLQEVLHWRLVLVRFHHCCGEFITSKMPSADISQYKTMGRNDIWQFLIMFEIFWISDARRDDCVIYYVRILLLASSQLSLPHK